MTNFNYENALKVTEKYLAEKYPGQSYTARPGNNCVWVSKGRLEMYVLVKNNEVVAVEID